MKSSDGTLWAGTWHGAYYQQDDAWSRITVDDGLLDNYVNTMIEDNNGGLWFGSYTAPKGGISILMDGEWQYFTTDNGLVHNNIVQFFEDTDGSIWASTGLMDIGAAIRFEYNGESWEIAETLDSSDGLPVGKVRSVYRDPAGFLWIGSENNGLSVQTANGFKILTTDDGLSHDEVKVYFVASEGELWLGTRNGITILSSDDLEDIRGT
jgi:ligand-binding sensor domain-containing protein